MSAVYTIPLQRKTRCQDCGHWAVAGICPLCKEPRAVFWMLRAASAPTVTQIKPRVKGRVS